MKYEAKRDLSFQFSPSCPDITFVKSPDSSPSPTYVFLSLAYKYAHAAPFQHLCGHVHTNTH